ncbi:MAG: hypothetical protein FJW93_02630 [Actinobacteria bacterium]|nr:hypothetical protein [Actinomycetota bacterium]MBM3816049.1 hypothetical protein [Actinomycetota bacterium]
MPARRLVRADVQELWWRIAIVSVVVLVAAVVTIRRRNARQAPTQPRGSVPSQLDRSDFSAPQTPWLVVAFTSSTCATCGDVLRKASVLASKEVAVQEAEYSRDRALHDRYHIDAVPALVIADSLGVVRFGHLGPLSATDLWAAMARCRDPQLPVTECAAPTTESPTAPTNESPHSS